MSRQHPEAIWLLLLEPVHLDIIYAPEEATVQCVTVFLPAVHDRRIDEC